LTATELAERLGLTKSTAHRLAAALAERGFLAPTRAMAIAWGPHAGAGPSRGGTGRHHPGRPPASRTWAR
jgi:predicted ArsR family transcriptional regulator